MGGSYKQARQFERAAIREKGTLVVNGENHPGTISRVGGGGVFFETALDLPRGQAVLLRFRLACFDEPILVKGEVRSRTEANVNGPAGLGIAFVDLDPKKQAQIVEFVAERGNVLCEVNGLLEDEELDVNRMRKLLASVDLDRIGSLDDLRARVRAGIQDLLERG